MKDLCFICFIGYESHHYATLHIIIYFVDLSFSLWADWLIDSQNMYSRLNLRFKWLCEANFCQLTNGFKFSGGFHAEGHLVWKKTRKNEIRKYFYIKREKEKQMRAEDIFYKANVIYLKSLTCLRSQLLTTLTTRYDASGSGWLTTLAKNNLLEGKQWVENLNHNNSTIVSKHKRAIIHFQTSVSPGSLKLVETAVVWGMMVANFFP